MNLSKIFILLAIFMLLPAVSDAQDLHFLTISDIHLSTDPNAPIMNINPPPKKGGDLDEGTFNKLMSSIKSFSGGTKPAFVINLGDVVAHHTPPQFISTDEKTVYQALLNTFPAVPIINIFGNNDSPATDYGNYMANGTSPYIVATTMTSPKFTDGFLSTGAWCDKNPLPNQPCILNENKDLGFVSIKLQPNLILIGLNSVMFTPRHGADPNHVTTQLNFVSDQLKNNPASSVLIAMHVPIGQNVYDGSLFWDKNIQENFLRKIAPYKARIKGILVAHTHMEEFKIINLGGKNIGEYFTAGLSTSHGNSPSVKIFNMTQNGGSWSIRNYTAYQIHSASGPVTKLYDFASAYDCNNNDINNCLEGLKSQFNKTLPFFTVGNPNYKNYPANPTFFVVK